jgi:hypothetical protein
MALTNLLLKSKCMLKPFWIFLCFMYKKNDFFCMKIRCDDFFLSLRDLSVCMKNKIFFFCLTIFFAMFWRKPDILILDLYLYGTKIQTSIKQFWFKKMQENQQNFLRIFQKLYIYIITMWAGPNSAQKGLRQSWPNSLSVFKSGPTQPRHQGWARTGLAQKRKTHKG